MTFMQHRLTRLSACLLAALFLCALPAFTSGKSWVTVTRKAGTVESKLANSQSWLRIPNSRRLGLNDSVRTDASGKAHLKLADNSIIALASNTTVVMREFVLNAHQRNVNVELQQGNLRTQVSKFRGKDNRYQITSPNAVMAAQGTDYSVKVTGEGDAVKTHTRVHSGSVMMLNLLTNENVLVPAGYEAIVEANAVTQATPITETGVEGASVDEANDTIELPAGGDEKLQAVPADSRGELGSQAEPVGLTSIGSSGDNTNQATPIVPGDTPSSGSSTGSVVIDLTPFLH
ncbi:FecR domain-containing protein [bacterium]|nr:FecR domain-containing protein [bacterium]